MSARGKHRGHDIVFLGGVWVYDEDNTPVPKDPFRKCGFCQIPQTPEGHDGCLGTLKGVMNACCGHGGTSKPYVQFPGGKVIDGEEALKYIGKSKQMIISALLASLLVSCQLTYPDDPTPPDDPASDAGAFETGGGLINPATCETTCSHQRGLGCPIAEDTPNGHTCEEVCENLELKPIEELKWDLDCLSRAAACEECDES